MDNKEKFGEFEIDQTQLTSLNFNEPELKGFDVSDIFEPVQSQPKKRFGKRSDRRAEVKVKVIDAFREPTPVAKEEPKVEEPIIAQPVVEHKDMDTARSMIADTIQEMQREEEQVSQSVEEPEEAVEKTAEFVVEQQEEPTVEKTAEFVVEEEPVEEAIEEEAVEEEVVEETIVKPQFVYEKSEEDSDEYDEDELLYEKKRFLISQYDKKEKYLEKQSKDGYHLVRSSGKKYYFREGIKKDYYYNYAYFKNEPTDDQYDAWEKDGWKLVCRNNAKKKRDAGWFVFRNEDHPGEYRKSIDNDEEKFMFFKKEVNSYRSTQFLLFICMVICAISAYLQYLFKGYLAFIIACAVIFLFAFIYFCRYGRLSFGANRKKKLLKSKLRVKEKEQFIASQSESDVSESLEDLDQDWNTLEDIVKDRKKTKKRRR